MAFGLTGWRGPESLPRGLGGPEPAGRGGRGATARVPGRRCAVARSGVRADRWRSWPGACWQSRSRWSSRSASRTTSTSSPACPSWTSAGSPTTTPASLLASALPGRLDEHVRDQIVAETRGNPLALLELPRGLTPAELAGGFGLPDARPLASRVEETFVHRVQALPTRDPAAAAAGGGRAGRRREPVVARGRAARDQRSTRARPAEEAGLDRVRDPGAVPASARPLGRLPGRSLARPPASAPSAGRGDRPRRRSRPPRLAPSAGGVRARRGRGRRAGTLGRPGAGTAAGWQRPPRSCSGRPS